ncbi:GntR family transcriptional regulator [Parachryseolinea silvisoli]|uniref:GntR family transcriptional regulator n=1 Tax=Parachryseolinea silvisoli TaxID=2873601 RepID=UPI002265F908|nr:GntR family transcriptional regulator [Parachryseolinea silvisoli]MCD9019178.1 GntR family transcriptional regulator [Parachryseolinea silvisoli]
MEFRGDQAIYLQIADTFCENILLGKWKALDRIPSVRDLAVEIEVNPNTVVKTYIFLQEKGIIFNKRGVGYFVAEDGMEKTIALLKENFVYTEVPRFFKTMHLLNLSLDDMRVYYQEYKSRENTKNQKDSAD